jgi:hypothetical protein
VRYWRGSIARRRGRGGVVLSLLVFGVYDD